MGIDLDNITFGDSKLCRHNRMPRVCLSCEIDQLRENVKRLEGRATKAESDLAAMKQEREDALDGQKELQALIDQSFDREVALRKAAELMLVESLPVFKIYDEDYEEHEMPMHYPTPDAMSIAMTKLSEALQQTKPTEEG